MNKGQGHWRGGRIEGTGEGIHACAPAVQDVGGQGDVFKASASAACDNALIHLHALRSHLVLQAEACRSLAELGPGLFLDACKDILRVLLHFLHRVDIARMEGQGDHGLDGCEIHLHKGVKGCGFVVAKLLVGVLSAVQGKVVLHALVRLPDGGKTGGFGGHDVYAAAVFHGQVPYARASEFHDLVLDKAVLEDSADDGKGHVLGAYAGPWGILKPDEHDFGLRNVIGARKQLLHKLGAALADAHAAKGTIAGVAVGAQDHLAATGQHFPRVLMDDSEVCGHKDAAVLLCCRKAEDMIVLVDGAAHGTEAVVAVGQAVGKGKFLKAACPGSLNDAHIGDVVGNECVKGDVKEVVLFGSLAVGLHDAAG